MYREKDWIKSSTILENNFEVNIDIKLANPMAARSKAWVCGHCCWDCGFEFRRGHGYLSLVSVVCCQAAHSSRGVLMSVVYECDGGASIMSSPGPKWGLLGHGNKTH